jgi:hypothetical protein
MVSADRKHPVPQAFYPGERAAAASPQTPTPDPQPRESSGTNEEPIMTDHKKKGDFKKNGKEDVGGNKKQDNSTNSDSLTGNQNAGHGGHS